MTHDIDDETSDWLCLTPTHGPDGERLTAAQRLAHAGTALAAYNTRALVTFAADLSRDHPDLTARERAAILHRVTELTATESKTLLSRIEAELAIEHAATVPSSDTKH